MLFRNKPSEMPSPQVSITSTDPELIQWVMDHFGGKKVKQKTYADHHRPAQIWKVSNRKALEILEGVLPYLQIPRKRKRAHLLVDEYLVCTPRNGRYTEEMKAAKTSLIERFKQV